MYTPLNQYHVVMEAAPEYWQEPDTLRRIYVRSPAGQRGSVKRVRAPCAGGRLTVGDAPGAVPGGYDVIQPAAGVSLGEAVDADHAAAREVGLPAGLQTHFRRHGASLSGFAGESSPSLIAAALATVYLVLGILYESYVHPVTILSTLPRPAWARCWR